MFEPSHIESSLPAPSFIPTPRKPPSAGLTTFPNPFADEQEPGLLPALFSKVKQTFTSTTTYQPSLSTNKNRGIGPVQDVVTQAQAPTEAQQIVEAARVRPQGRRQSGPVPVPIQTHDSSALQPSESVPRDRPSPTHGRASSSSLAHSSLTLPIITSTSDGDATVLKSSAGPASLSQGPSRALIAPGDRQWRPTGIAPAQVTISPVTSLTTTIQVSRSSSGLSSSGPSKVTHRAHFGLQAVASSSRSIHHRHAQTKSHGSFHLRRSSINTVPDSPSSVSLSAMIAANAEFSQNVSHVPGFPLQDDSRSVRSLGIAKKSNGVSRIIRRMRGEGLSKHYWMADERCKECYDCKSVSEATIEGTEETDPFRRSPLGDENITVGYAARSSVADVLPISLVRGALAKKERSGCVICV